MMGTDIRQSNHFLVFHSNLIYSLYIIIYVKDKLRNVGTTSGKIRRKRIWKVRERFSYDRIVFPLAVYTQGNRNSKRQVFVNNRNYLHQGIIENNTPKMEKTIVDEPNSGLTQRRNRKSGI
jgi:hypothetical protein